MSANYAHMKIAILEGANMYQTCVFFLTNAFPMDNDLPLWYCGYLVLPFLQRNGRLSPNNILILSKNHLVQLHIKNR